MDRLDMIETFAAVARHEGFSAASRYLGQPLATVSRKVTALEHRLGVQLFVRTTRSVKLTDDGARYLAKVVPLVSAFDEAESTVKQAHQALSGELTITSPVPIGTRYLVPIISNFLKVSPEVNVHHVFNDQRLDYINAGIDIGLRIGPLRDSGLKLLNLGKVRVLTCASPEYLENYGYPVTPDDLEKHRLVALGGLGERSRWNFARLGNGEYFVDIRPVYKVDSIEAVVRFVEQGGGIGRFYSYQVADLIAEGRLKVIMHDFELSVRPVSYLYPGSNYLPRRTRAFLDFSAPLLRSKLAEIQKMVDT